MGYRTNNLHSFFISKDDNEQDQNLIDMWETLDEDYGEIDFNYKDFDEEEQEELDEIKILGYTSKAEQEIKQKDWVEDGYDDLSKIERVLNWIEDVHGSFSTQFMFEITECDEGYAVAVSYLT